MKETITTTDGRTITRMELSDLGPITQREQDMIREASKRPVVYDEDCLPLRNCAEIIQSFSIRIPV